MRISFSGVSSCTTAALLPVPVIDDVEPLLDAFSVPSPQQLIYTDKNHAYYNNSIKSCVKNMIEAVCLEIENQLNSKLKTINAALFSQGGEKSLVLRRHYSH